MENTKSISVDQIRVYTTSVYSVFKTLDGNRNINQIHLARLKESIKKNYLTTIILVNDSFEIIDGQHRFLICKELGLPINYIVVSNYGLREVQVLNANMKNWSTSDYIDGYCDLGYKDYILYREFVKKYKLNHTNAQSLLSGSAHTGVGQKRHLVEGTFKVIDYDIACEIAEKIIMVKPYYEGYKRRSFVFALSGIIKNKNFSFTEFLSKLSLQPTALKDCVNTGQYKALIENIYNYKRREKVNLRF